MNDDKKRTEDKIDQILKEARIKWDHSQMQTTYSNVVNVARGREEISIFFGTNKTWDLEEIEEIVVELTRRILMNPYAAKRLSVLLNRVIEEYERRFGPLGVGEKTHTVH